MVRGTWIAATGQRWKLIVCFAGAALAGALFLVDFFVEPARSDLRPFDLSLAATVMGFLSLTWLVTSVRCPRCLGRPAWYAVRKLDVNRWLHVLMFSTGCPICGATCTTRPAEDGA